MAYTIGQKGLYKVQVENRNAFWAYEVTSDTGFTVKFGRIGTPGSSAPKSFPTSSKRDRELDKLIKEKLNKGYKAETEEGLKKDTDIANALGAQYKIQRIIYVSSLRDDNKLNILDEYYPENGIVVEVLQSWTKDTTYIHLTKDKNVAFELVGASIFSGTISFTHYRRSLNTTWINALRKYIKETSEVVKKIILTKFGDVTRQLSLDGGIDDDEQAIIQELDAQGGGGSTIGKQALLSFAMLGDRVLDL